MLCGGLVASLQQRRRYWEDKLELVRAGEQVLPPPASAQQRLASKRELVEWHVDLLEARGYVNWVEFMEGIKLMLSNAFPKLRRESQEENLRDVIRVYEAHTHMAEETADLLRHV